MSQLTETFRFNSVRKFEDWYDREVTPILCSETLPRITQVKLFDRLRGNKIKVEITKEIQEPA